MEYEYKLMPRDEIADFVAIFGDDTVDRHDVLHCLSSLKKRFSPLRIMLFNYRYGIHPLCIEWANRQNVRYFLMRDRYAKPEEKPVDLYADRIINIRLKGSLLLGNSPHWEELANRVKDAGIPLWRPSAS